tara:strand:- start:459 stop:827 length:369 start_codon:yes stop_codon:yes gene_type:complete
MAFRMKAYGSGSSPMKKNFPSAFKKDPPGSKKVKVFEGGMTVDVSTEKGRDILKEINSIPTVSSTEPGRVTKAAKKILKGAGKITGKALMGGIIDPTNKTSPRLSDRKQFKSKVNSNSKKIY